MTPLQWVLLCVLFTLYLLFGGGVFMYFEQYRELEKKEEISVLRKDIKEILLQLDNEFYHNDTTSEVIHALRTAKEGVINRIASVCDISQGLLVPDDQPLNKHVPTEDNQERLKWNFYNSVFFAFTVLTTIGYGHLSPSTNWSKWFVMLYALIGIPITTMLLSALGDYFSSRLTRVHKKSKDNKHKNKWSFVLKILFYLIPGFIVFILFPSGIFVLIESWTFLDAIYFSFVTLTTIGFGDYVAGMGPGHTVWLSIYKAAIIIWITFGLGYFIMILSFISKGLTHKKVRVVLEKRLNTTREKLSRDIDYMRRVVNELYLMKINPVYEIDHEEEEFYRAKAKRAQSQSCIRFENKYSSLPRISNLPGVVPALSRTFSEPKFQEDDNQWQRSSAYQETPKLPRRCSDSDLSNINRDKTFESAVRNFVTADELLVTVVNALSGNVMQDVMDAVEELNNYEGEDDVKEVQKGTRNKDMEAQRVDSDESFEDVPPWDLGTLSESDEEELIGGDEGDEDPNDKLKQIVVHNASVDETKHNFMDRVTGAIRKISAGSRSPQEGPSRKVSRNESERRKKISRNESFERRMSGQRSTFLNPHAYCNPIDTKSICQEKSISEERRRSRNSIHSSRSPRNTLDETASTNLTSSGKTTPIKENRSSAKLSLETTSLAEFLKALDTVHSRLNAKTSEHSMGGESNHFFDDQTFANEFPTTTPRSRRLSTDVRNNRRRKMGMTLPDFSYVNYGFHEDPNKQTKDDPPDRK